MYNLDLLNFLNENQDAGEVMNDLQNIIDDNKLWNDKEWKHIYELTEMFREYYILTNRRYVAGCLEENETSKKDRELVYCILASGFKRQKDAEIVEEILSGLE